MKAHKTTYHHFHRRVSLLLTGMLVLLAVACNPTEQGQGDQPQAAHTETFAEQNCTVEITLDRTQLTVADQLQLRLTAVSPEGFSIVFPTIKNEDESGFSWQQELPAPQAMTPDGMVRNQQVYLGEPYLPGDYNLPPLKIIFQPSAAGSTAITIATKPISVKIISLLENDPNPQQLSDIGTPMEQPWSRTQQLIAALTLLALVAAMGFGLWYWLRRRRQRQNAPPPPILPHIKALGELETFLAQGHLEAGRIKQFHHGVSDILRRYIENRFGLRAPERSTEEFLIELGRANDLGNEQKLLLRNFLTQCDLVKFAKHRPSEHESRKEADLCRQFIEETAVQPREGGQ